MAGSLRGPRAKIERAEKHIHELETGLGEFVEFTHSTNPDVIGLDKDWDAGKQVYKVASVPEVPDAVSTAIGDVIHNLRSALDLLMAQLIIGNGGTPTEEYFPIAGSRKKYVSRCKTEIQGLVGQDAFKLICDTEAYRGGNGDALWRIHRIDIEDKHRILIVTGLRFRSANLPLPDVSEALSNLASKVFFRPADTMAPLEEGDELLIDVLPSQSKHEPKFRLEVAFGQSEVVKGQPVLPTLTQFRDATKTVVESFGTVVSGE